MLVESKSCPPPRLAYNAWLARAGHDFASEVGAELRSYMFRRMASLVSGALTGLVLTTALVIRYPTPGFKLWLAYDVAFFLVRIALVIAIIRYLRRPLPLRRGGAWMTDLQMITGQWWCAQIGLTTIVCLASGDPVLSILAVTVSTGIGGGLCARNPGAPRQTVVLLVLIVIPAAIGAILHPEPMVGVIAVMAPIYLVGMISINRQLHADYVAMIVARLESRRHARHCSLTGLPNRAAFDDALEAAFAEPSLPEGSVALLCLDLDGFKTVNDAFGHPTGDELLRQVSNRLAQLDRPHALVARLGGDEFAVLLPGCAAPEAERTAAALIERIGLPYRLGLHPVTIGVSIGIALRERGVETGKGAEARHLVSCADQALYVAKRLGKNTYYRHGSSDVDALRSLAYRLRSAHDGALRTNTV